jgi:hypothetical protein
MSPKTESLGVTLLSNTTTCTSLDMQATSRHLDSYCATTGGPRCPGTLESTLKPVTSAISSVDFIVELPQVHGYSMIMVVINSVTKRAHFISTHSQCRRSSQTVPQMRSGSTMVYPA